MHPNDGRVVSNFIVQALKGEPITVHGKGRQTRSFCYVSDTVEAFVRLMSTDADFTGPVNIGNPQECTVLELAELVVSLTSSRSEIVFAPLPTDDPVRRCPDIQLARAMLGWEPKVPLREGLTATIDYFERKLTGRAASSAPHPSTASPGWV
jgi:UDP-glucuronate decarboxylase